MTMKRRERGLWGWRLANEWEKGGEEGGDSLPREMGYQTKRGDEQKCGKCDAIEESKDDQESQQRRCERRCPLL